MPFYQSIAPYYDDIFQLSPALKGFIDSFEIQPDGRVLEIGCGTGETAFYIGEKTSRLDAIDLDEEMIRISREKAIGRKKEFIRFQGMDMMRIDQYFGENQFGIIFCLGNTLVHLKDAPEMEAFFKKAGKALGKDGSFVFQILNYDRILKQPLMELPLIENERLRFEREYRFADGGKNLYFDTILTDKKDRRVIRNRVLLYPLRSFEIRDIAEKAGFENVLLYGDFSRSPFNSENSDLMVAVLK